VTWSQRIVSPKRSADYSRGGMRVKGNGRLQVARRGAAGEKTRRGAAGYL